MRARKLLSEMTEAGLSVMVESDCLVVQPASKLNEEMRSALRDSKAELLALLKFKCSSSATVELLEPSWTDLEVLAYRKQCARLLSWGWRIQDAERFAATLVERDRSRDDRVCCLECRHYQPGCCWNYRKAGLATRFVGIDLAALSQRCPGFADPC